MAEDVFQDMERILHPRTHLGFHPLQFQGQLLDHSLRQRSDFARLGRDMPLHPLRPSNDLRPLFHILKPSIGGDFLLFPTQQLMRLDDVRHVRRGACHEVHQSRLRIHADLRFHPEIPLMPFLLWRISGVAFLTRTLCRRRRTDDCRTHDRPFLFPSILPLRETPWLFHGRHLPKVPPRFLFFPPLERD